MKATPVIVAATLLAAGLLALPLDLAPVHSAEARACPILEGPREYLECMDENCEDPSLKDPVPMCYD